jgi:subfamily B ATP-binding cassette protein MsbA
MQAVDRIIYGDNIDLLLQLLVVWFVAISLRGAGNYLKFYNLLIFRQRMVIKGQATLMKHLMKAPLRYFSSSNIGYVVCRVRDDVAQLHPFWAGTLISVIQSLVTVVVSLVLLVVISTTLTLSVVVLAPVYLASSFMFMKQLRQLSYEANERAGIAEGKLHESISGAAVVKELGLERGVIATYFNKLIQATRTRIRLEVLDHIKGNVGQVLQSLVPVLVFIQSGYLIYTEDLTVGEFIGFSVYISFLLNPLSSLFSVNTQVQRALAPLQRITEILQIESEDAVSIRPGGVSSPIKGKVDLSHVYFSYDGKNNALNDVTVEVAPHSTTGFCGTSGAGKTTIINLLMRFYETDSGSISIDGRPIGSIPFDELRRSIGVVSQDVFLFNDTVYHNLTCGKRGVNQQQVVDAAKKAGAHSFILEFDQGYDSVVGVRGQKISGGQRVRLAIARALIRKPPIIVFDEATAFLDSETERLFREATNKLFREHTVLVISHRIASVRHADRIYVMDHGRIIQSGSHKDLVNAPGLYHKLCREQSEESLERPSAVKIP